MQTGFFRKKRNVILLILLAGFVALQAIRADIPQEPANKAMETPAAVTAVLQKACFDCHSNQTQLAWFDQLVPAQWLVASHIKEGRKVLNFSHWDSLSAGDRKAKLFESLNQMMFQTMPLPSYTALHSKARISPQDIEVLKSYLSGMLTTGKASDSTHVQATLQQFAQWQRQGTPDTTSIKATLNGIAYIHGYDNWTAISTTERLDNGTMRIIFGNDVAVKAIQEHHTNPWPDGTILAKVAWDQLTDTAGQVTTGEYKQVEFMIKDNDKYDDTNGWGFARWKGLQPQPYGKNELFTTECVNCHQPMRDNDFVFTTPQTAQAFGTSNPPVKVLTSTIDKKEHTTALLYGNTTAYTWARSHNTGDYPAGAVLTMVTWQQADDDNWFGARIPDKAIYTEEVQFTGKAQQPVIYHRYKGNTREEMPALTSQATSQRIQHIIHLKAAVMPG